ncbi:membrane integrity-associated transporter subunit PqiC [Alteromonas mediterranea]|uniref:PqiC family protein n=1 Tax=Alteromonas mediterranea TaxID=314275 RepID=UPI0012FCEFA7|nr:ABC-type transport auxiliary lipoprotein family protein [Alteromonas mediterranea]QGX61291.1 hypothetical protein FJN15_05800 [Alteromonas mediterranea]
MMMQSKATSSFTKRKTIYISTLAFLICFLSACSSAPTGLTYYLLHATGDVSYIQEDAKQTIVLDKITLPEYLKHRGLVYQTSDTNLHISTSHLWAEPVDEGLTKSLTGALAVKRVSLVRPDHYASEESVHMTLHIDDFVSTYEGEVVFSGQFVITRASGENTPHSFVFTSPLANDGFSSSVKAMRDAIEKLAVDISKAAVSAG